MSGSLLRQYVSGAAYREGSPHDVAPDSRHFAMGPGGYKELCEGGVNCFRVD